MITPTQKQLELLQYVNDHYGNPDHALLTLMEHKPNTEQVTDNQGIGGRVAEDLEEPTYFYLLVTAMLIKEQFKNGSLKRVITEIKDKDIVPLDKLIHRKLSDTGFVLKPSVEQLMTKYRRLDKEHAEGLPIKQRVTEFFNWKANITAKQDP